MKSLFLPVSAVLLLAMLAAAAPLSAQTVEQWQKAAVQKHPALAQAGSPLNQRFLALVAEKRKSDPAFFAKPDWPLRAAAEAAAASGAGETAATPQPQAGTEKPPAPPAAPAAEMTPEEQEWERDTARWVFERLAFGDSEEVIARKLYRSKLVKARAVAAIRTDLNSRFSWILGESKFFLGFEMKDGLAAITFDCRPEKTTALEDLIREDWDRLRAGAIEQFGPPATSVEFPTVPKLKRGGFTMTDSWERPNARINLGISEADGKCSATLRISDPARAAE
jgi:hypothetical protein